jgi:hypothetical protein
MPKPAKHKRGGARPGAGRPASDTSLRNQSKITVLIPNHQRRFLESIAVQTGVTVPGLVRHVLSDMVECAFNSGKRVNPRGTPGAATRTTKSKKRSFDRLGPSVPDHETAV